MISGACPLLVEADMTSAVTVGAPMSANSAQRRLRDLSWRNSPTAGYGPILPVGVRQLMGVLLTVSSATRWLFMTQTGPEQVQHRRVS
jgi:hypothetical protein